jgi:hypothetical protein
MNTTSPGDKYCIHRIIFVPQEWIIYHRLAYCPPPPQWIYPDTTRNIVLV